MKQLLSSIIACLLCATAAMLVTTTTIAAFTFGWVSSAVCIGLLQFAEREK